MPPRLQPTRCTGRPPACALTSRIAAGAPRRPSAPCRGSGWRRRPRRTPRGTSDARADEVLDERAAAAQVEAERGRGQRGDQQHRVTVLADRAVGPVVVDLAQHAVVDQRAGHGTEVGQPAVEHLVGDVGGRGDDLVRLGDQIHADKLQRVEPRDASLSARSSRARPCARRAAYLLVPRRRAGPATAPTCSTSPPRRGRAPPRRAPGTARASQSGRVVAARQARAAHRPQAASRPPARPRRAIRRARAGGDPSSQT